MSVKTYRDVAIEYRPEITGLAGPIFGVVLKGRKSFASLEEKQHYVTYIQANTQHPQRLLESDFTPIDTQKVTEIRFFPPTKGIQPIDIIPFNTYQAGFDFLISEKALNVLKQHRIPHINHLSATIHSLQAKYAMVGFPLVPNERIDFGKSTFFDPERRRTITYKDHQEYAQSITAYYPSTLYVLGVGNYDIIHLENQGLYFSDNFFQAMEASGIIGISKGPSVLYNTMRVT